MTSNQDHWIGLEEALRLQAQLLGLPPSWYLESLKKLPPLSPGIMWLSDQAIMLHQLSSGFAFDRAEFEAVLAKIKPAGDHGDA